MKKFMESIRYDWDAKAALVHTCCISLWIMSLCIPISSIIIFIKSLIFSNVPTDTIRTTSYVFVTYFIFINLIKWQYVNIFNWIMNRIYRRTKWNGIIE